ncbi:MAG: O-antigen ligase family protein [Desulfobacterales bacterium]|nr:O-antigen ligase family protein [Desulfobacterales bacterium]
MKRLTEYLSPVRSHDLTGSCVLLTFFLFPTGTAPPVISFSLAIVVWFFSGKFSALKSIAGQPWFWPVLPLVILPWAGLLYSQNMELGLDYAEKSKYWLAVLLTAGMAFTDRRMEILIAGLWAGLSIGAVLAAIQFFGIMPPVKDGHLGFGIVHTLISMYLIIGLLMVSFYFRSTESRKKRLALLLLFGLFLFHLAVLRGRSGYLIFGLVSPLIANNLMHRFSFKAKSVVCFSLLGILLLSPVVRTVVQDSYVKLNQQKTEILRGERSEDFIRFYITTETLKLIKEHPILGIGTGSLTEPTKAKGHLVTHPHNNILYMWVSFGIAGLAACLWLFWTMLKLSWKSRESAVGFFVLSSCIVMFMGGMFDTSILNTGTLLFLTLSYGLLHHLPNTDKPRE